MKRNGYMFYGLMLLSGIAHTNSPNTPKTIKQDSRIVTTLSLGMDFIRTNGNQNVSLLPPYTQYYTGNSSYKSSGSLGIGGGLERSFNSAIFWQLGLAGLFNTSVRAQGDIWQLGLPEFANLSYEYQVRSSRVVATGKLLSTYHQKFHPYFSGELGASFNQAFSYQEHALIEEAVPMVPFTNHTQTSLTWGAGLGIDMDINAILRLGVGYQFVDLGKMALGISPAQETQNTVTIRHLYDNQVRIQLTALI